MDTITVKKYKLTTDFYMTTYQSQNQSQSQSQNVTNKINEFVNKHNIMEISSFVLRTNEKYPYAEIIRDWDVNYYGHINDKIIYSTLKSSDERRVMEFFNYITEYIII